MSLPTVARAAVVELRILGRCSAWGWCPAPAKP